MSECVVRMEMPKACSWIENGEKKRCPIAEWGGACAITKQFKMPDGCRPSWCPIICQLPDGHGRLVDAEEMYKKSEAFCNQCRQGDHDCEKCNYIVAQGYMYKSPTIVPAAAERSETCLD